jgi:predicted outer membrane repeat protein
MKTPIATILAAALLGSTALAATFNISAGDVPGLKAAINAANSNLQDDTILLGRGTYVLSAVDNTGPDGAANGLPEIGPDEGHSLTIRGQGQGAIIQRSASQKSAFRILHIRLASHVTLENLTIANGAASTTGGGILCEGNVVAVLRCAFSGNVAASGGGAICNSGVTEAVDAPARILRIENSIFSGNVTTSGGGGGILNADNFVLTTISITNCAFIANSAAGSGGAI